ncbi:MAG TPA: M67 family metallopeptidase [Candidatus Binatia bacterium]|nr:M67 family metallopeptidase [Candidatus Binatia bacterium]
MNSQRAIRLSQSAWDEISGHAREAFPEECCGIVLADGAADEVRRLSNIQNKLHALDPQTYPRTAAIAYAMDPLELDRVLRESETRGRKLKAFYHSHPDHDAYFSAEDKAFACPFGEPTYPEAAQIVVSIYNRAVKIIRAFAWSEKDGDFVEIPIDRTPWHDRTA